MASSDEVIAVLKRDGWKKVRQKGSHVRMVSPDGQRKATVPHPVKDIKPGTLASIERQTGKKFR